MPTENKNDWLIVNGKSRHLGLLYAKRFGDQVHYMFIFTFLCSYSFRDLFVSYHTVLSYMNNFKKIYLTHRWDPNLYYHSQPRVDLRVIAMKGYSILPRPYHQTQFYMVGGDIMFLIFNFHFVVVYLICFYMWLHVLRKSEGRRL